MNINISSLPYKEIIDIIKSSSQELDFKAFLIGGFVRDFILSRNSKKDIDILTDKSGIKLAQRVSYKLNKSTKLNIFKNFGTAMLNYKDIQIEFVGARKESYLYDSRKPIVQKGLLYDDFLRRDFTINTIAIDINKDEILDPFNGIEDIKNRIIKTPPINPDITFSDDPLRMIRAIRFACVLDFNIKKETFEAIKNNSHRISIVSKERIVDELNKILLSPTPSIGLNLLFEADILEKILPELTNLNLKESIGNKSHKNNFYHTLKVVDNIRTKTNNIWLIWSALLHDIGKYYVRKFDKDIGWTFHGHEIIGSKKVYEIFKRLRMPTNHKMKYVKNIIANSSRPVDLSKQNTTDSAFRRLILDMGENLDDLFTLCVADITTKNITKLNNYRQNINSIKKKIEDIKQKDKLKKWKNPVSGYIIMEALGIAPSKKVGQVQEFIKEAIMEGKIKNNFEDAYDFMLKNKSSL